MTGRVPLVADGMPEDTPSARRLGAAILGRALAHEAADTELWLFPRTTAGMCGFSDDEIPAVVAAHNELLGA